MNNVKAWSLTAKHLGRISKRYYGNESKSWRQHVKYSVGKKAPGAHVARASHLTGGFIYYYDDVRTDGGTNYRKRAYAANQKRLIDLFISRTEVS